MPFFLLSIAGGGAIAYLLIRSGLAIPALIAFIIFTALLWTNPTGAATVAMLVIAACGVLAAITYWEATVAIILGFILFIFFMLGLLHAINVVAK